MDSSLSVRGLRDNELLAATELVARVMESNPVHEQIFGSDPEHRRRVLFKFFALTLPWIRARGDLIGAFADERLVGVLGMVRPGRCRLSMGEALGTLPSLIRGMSPVELLRVRRWMKEWGNRDPDEPHWHLGPVAVDVDLQGNGIGSRLLTTFCARVDLLGELAYLETDRAINVPFYERFGFVTSEVAMVLGRENWFMRREGG